MTAAKKKLQIPTLQERGTALLEEILDAGPKYSAACVMVSPTALRH
jgi:hypothetical protein